VFFDSDNLEKSKFDFVVKVDSINTNNGKRDNLLRSDVLITLEMIRDK
jgi:polyisoprenoid-binding protein YceI